MRPWRAVLTIAAVCGVAWLGAWLLRDWRGGGEVMAWERRPVGELQQDSGHAFIAPLPSGAPDAANGPIRAIVFEDGRPTVGEADHATIRAAGGGHWSFWGGKLWFSASDNSDPRNNGRRYEVAWPPRLLPTLEGGVRIGAWLLTILAPLLIVLMAVGRRRALDWLRRRRRLFAKMALIPLSILVVLIPMEIILRCRYPFADNTWPCRFEPAYGFSFTPGATVRQTNLFDYCVEQQANSLGFLDREIPIEKPPATRRILVLGDSYVEAVQVPLAGKFHVVLEDRLRARGQDVQTIGLGMSGNGTSNELAYYEAIGRRFRPDLVVVLLVKNDIANNSPLLEAVRYGWHPQHMPRQFFASDADGCHRLPIATDWEAHVFHKQPVAPPAAGSDWLSWSRVYRWTAATVTHAQRQAEADANSAYARRVELLRRDPAQASALAGWELPDDLDLDTMTATIDPPPAFRDAVRLTEHALQQLQQAVQADGSRLVAVSCQHVGEAPGLPVVSPAGSKRPLRQALPRGWLDHFEPMCQRLGIPMLDLKPEFERRGVFDKCTFVRDGHWNAIGHATAAAAIDEWLAAHPELLAGSVR